MRERARARAKESEIDRQTDRLRLGERKNVVVRRAGFVRSINPGHQMRFLTGG